MRFQTRSKLISLPLSSQIKQDLLSKITQRLCRQGSSVTLCMCFQVCSGYHFPPERKVHSKESHFFLNNVSAVYINSSGTPRASWQASLRNVISAWTTTAQPKANKEKNEFEGRLTIYHRCVTILSKKTQHEADF